MNLSVRKKVHLARVYFRMLKILTEMVLKLGRKHIAKISEAHVDMSVF